MTATTQIWLWIAFIGMILGSIAFGLKAAGQRHREGMEFSMVSFFITLWAATMYLSMILSETVLFDFKGQHILFWGRYLDWVITTPLLLLDLGIISGVRPKLILGVIGADIFMIVTGFIATLEGAPTNYLWYTISCGAFLAILGALFTEFSDTARLRDGKVKQLFLRLRNILTVLWFGYPIVWLLGTEGLQTINVGFETACYAILDLCAKVGFGLVLVSAGRDVLSEASSGERRQQVAEAYLNEPTSRR